MVCYFYRLNSGTTSRTKNITAGADSEKTLWIPPAISHYFLVYKMLTILVLATRLGQKSGQ